MDDFGGLGGGRLLGPSPYRRKKSIMQDPEVIQPTPPTQAVEDAHATATAIDASGGVPVSVVYQTPAQRANAALRRSAIASVITLAIICMGLVYGFLTAGTFTREAVVVLVTAIAGNVIQATIAWLMKLRAAMGDDALAPPI